MPARQRMTHRVFIQANAATADAYGHPSVPSWGTANEVAGYVWVDTEDTGNDNEMTLVTGRYKGIVPIGTTVAENKYRVQKVENRADTPTQLFGIMDIMAVIRRRDHLELRLRGYA